MSMNVPGALVVSIHGPPGVGVGWVRGRCGVVVVSGCGVGVVCRCGCAWVCSDNGLRP